MPPIPNTPYSLKPLAQFLAPVTTLATVLLATVSCATESPSPSALPVPTPELAAETGFKPNNPLEPRPNLGNIDLSYWNYRTSPPEEELDLYVGDFICGFMYREAVPPGKWVLVGVSEEQRYTPILDIYSDQTGSSTQNDTVYYHFQLINSE